MIIGGDRMLGFVPMPHTVIISKASQLDDWGIPVADIKTSVKVACKISYNSNNEAISVASGEQVRYTARILCEGIPQVDYDDVISWSDDFGNVHNKPPLEIDYKHDLSGNPVALRVVV